jgi:hypothetical protein
LSAGRKESRAMNLGSYGCVIVVDRTCIQIIFILLKWETKKGETTKKYSDINKIINNLINI